MLSNSGKIVRKFIDLYRQNENKPLFVLEPTQVPICAKFISASKQLDDDAWEYVYPDPQLREEIKYEARKNQLEMNHKQFVLIKNPETIDSCSIWLPPNVKHGLFNKMKVFVEVTKKFGLENALKLKELDRSLERDKVMKDAKKYFYLFIHASTPISAGVDTIRPMLILADVQGRPCYVDVTRREDVRFFESLGFKVKLEHRMGNGAGPVCYCMRREPIRQREKD